MANPTVDKLKAIALRFADKVAVALTAVLCLVFVFLALNKETIETTPEALGEVANQAQQNINRPQDEESIVQKITDDGMVLQDFGPQVAARESTKVDVRQFSLARSFVKAEPGAGLIRDAVDDQLLAPYELIATAGRGGIPYAVRDESGELVPPDPAEQKNSMSSMAAMYGMGGGMPGMGGGGNTPKKGSREEMLAKQQKNIASTKSKQGIAGVAGVTVPDEPEEEEAITSMPADYKTEVRGQRWVTVVGLLNNKQFRERYAKALKVSVDSPESHPDYTRIEMSRQAYDPVLGDWTDWQTVDPNRLDQIVADAAFEEDPSVELTPDPVRLEPLVDFLPFLASGYWTGVHHAQLIPPEKLRELLSEREEDADDPANMGMMGMMGMMGGGRGGMGEMMGGGMPGMMGGEMMGGGMPGMMGGGMPGMMGGEMMGGGMPGMMGGGMGMMGGSGRPTSTGPEFMTDEDIVMVRGIDYTVDQDTTYRYRVRVVVANPNTNRDDVAPGVDIEAKEFAGPWSDPSDPVRVPANVSIYAVSPAPDAYGPGAVSFDVIAWNPSSGSLAYSNFPTAPGEFVGRERPLNIAMEGEEPKREVINFNSRELIVDTIGGSRPGRNFGLAGAIELPVVAAVLRPDGTIALHNQSVDAPDEQLKFMKESYKLSVSDELNKKDRGNNLGSMYGGMMGG